MYVTQACDACKRRKVKCDGVDPCANCKTSRLACGYTIVPRKRGRAARDKVVQGEPASGPRNKVTTRKPSPPGLRLPVAFGAYDPSTDPVCICTGLVQHLHQVLPGETMQDVAHLCIDLWKAFIYPVTPTGHEPTLRASISVFSRKAQLGPLLQSQASLEYMRSFALITALCALVASTAPESLLPAKAVLAGPLLLASRAMLASYESHDLEQPDSRSLIIRAWQASAMQNTSGRHGGAFQTHMGAELLALRLRLYDEQAVAKHAPHEAQQLRSIFWLLHHSDKASAAFSSRIYILDENNFDSDMTVLEYGNLAATPHLDITRLTLPLLDDLIHAAFHQKRKMWKSAADLVTSIRAHHGGPDEVDRLSGLYLDFTGSMEGFPPWLRLPNQLEESPETALHRERIAWAMRSNMMTSFHCLKLVVLQQCARRGLHRVMGVDDSSLSVGMRITGIAQDFLYELQTVPFDGFKMQGEPAVQRIRQVGSILLELAEKTPNETIKARAQAQFEQMLDYLAKLDSKVSDELF